MYSVYVLIISLEERAEQRGPARHLRADDDRHGKVLSKAPQGNE